MDRIDRALEVIRAKGWPDPFAAPEDITCLWDIDTEETRDVENFVAPDQYLLYQTWAGDQTYYATFATLEAAAEYVDSDDWQAWYVIDLDTGDKYYPKTAFVKGQPCDDQYGDPQ